MTEGEIAALIDHTLLKSEAIENDIVEVCKQAREAKFASVCVNPYWVPLVHQELMNSGVKTCSVAGFPLGANTQAVKLTEASIALRDGAAEIDMVINIGALRSGANQTVAAEIRELAAAAHTAGALLKVIIETCLLSNDQKRVACRLAAEAGADFVKTSTGFSREGATEADVRLMRAVVGPKIGVKASGGVRTLEALRRMVEAGANRIGTSSGIQILAEARGQTATAIRKESGGTY